MTLLIEDAALLPSGVCEVVGCHVWLGQTKGAMTDGGSTVRRSCSALLETMAAATARILATSGKLGR